MRYLFLERVTRLEKGRVIAGVTTFATAEEYLRGHFGREALVPGTILVEAMAQVLGWGIAHAHDFTLLPILSLVTGVAIHAPRLRPGVVAEITGEIVSTSQDDSLGKAWVEVAGSPVASVERVIYTHLAPVHHAWLRTTFAALGGVAAGRGGARGASLARPRQER